MNDYLPLVLTGFGLTASTIYYASVPRNSDCVADPYWAEELGKNKMRAYQFSERGSEMETELKDKVVKITGSAVQLIKGKCLSHSQLSNK
jgi:hypothetical protein